jgi:hypothetical protein
MSPSPPAPRCRAHWFRIFHFSGTLSRPDARGPTLFSKKGQISLQGGGGCRAKDEGSGEQYLTAPGLCYLSAPATRRGRACPHHRNAAFCMRLLRLSCTIGPMSSSRSPDWSQDCAIGWLMRKGFRCFPSFYNLRDVWEILPSLHETTPPLSKACGVIKDGQKPHGRMLSFVR